MEKQEQDIEGKSQATKDHATDQETIAALSLEYLPKGKTQRYRPSEPHMRMYWRKWPSQAVAGFSVKFRPTTPTEETQVGGTPWPCFMVIFLEVAEILLCGSIWTC